MNQDISLSIIRESVISQLSAAVETLSQAMSFFTEETWYAPHPDQPVNQVVFHTLFFADFYLQFGPAGFRDQSFHQEHPTLFQDYEELEDRVPQNTYDREECREYLDHCREKARLVIGSESPEVLGGDCGFPGRGMSRLELHIYNARHIQHHAAQLGLRNQLSAGEALRWIGRG